jgi:hypothetical protein
MSGQDSFVSPQRATADMSWRGQMTPTWWVYFVHGDDNWEMDGWESRDEIFLPAKMAENWRVDKDHMQSGGEKSVEH